jgi:phenylacetate-CoA ligase
MELWTDLMARSLACTGVRPGDIVHNAYGYGLFTGGLGLHYGAEKVGASVIPISGGNTKRQIIIMQDFGPTAITCTPSYALHLGEVAEEMGLNPAKDFKLRVGCFGAEPWSENMREQIEKKFNIFSTFCFVIKPYFIGQRAFLIISFFCYIGLPKHQI